MSATSTPLNPSAYIKKTAYQNISTSAKKEGLRKMREQNEKMKFIFFGSFHLFILAACAVKEVTDSSAKN